MILTKKYLDELTYEIIGSAMEVHRALGPGLLESIYHKCLTQEFLIRKISVVSEMKVPVYYKGLEIDAGLRPDFFIENILVLELKAVDKIIPIFETQILTYMKLLESPKGILINFNCANLYKDGQKTYVNQHFSELPLL
jgi:GxxExxY protein